MKVNFVFISSVGVQVGLFILYAVLKASVSPQASGILAD